MPNIQSTPRHVWACKKLHIGAGNLTSDTTGNVVLSAGVKISNAQLLTGDGTGIVFGNTNAALPGAVDGGAQLAALLDSTGVFRLAINTTGTAWKYLATTSVAADAD
jgi:hypothetical protein